MLGGRRRVSHFAAAVKGKACYYGERHGAVCQHHMPQSVALRRRRLERYEALGRSDKAANVAVARDVTDTFGVEQRIDRSERPIRSKRPERGGNHPDSLFQIDADALASLRAERDQTIGRTAHLLRQPGGRKRRIVVRQRGALRRMLYRAKHLVVRKVASSFI